MNRPNFRLALVGLAAGVIIALLIAPQTRLLLKMQLSPPSALKAALNGCPMPQAASFVANHPNDYQIQLAAPFDAQTQTQVQHARSLVSRFPDNASLRANILRYATLRDIKLYRAEDYLLRDQPAPKLDPRNREQQPSTPAALAAFDADAAAGERLDPNNAYFPLMRSGGLFASHRDAEALTAVERASQKSQWREYCEDEVEGHWRISDHLNGGRETLVSLSAAAALLLPQYARLRAVARIVTYKAVLLERAGHPLQALALRRALARCGYLMTTQSSLLIGNLVGTAISQDARMCLGGAPFPKSGLDALGEPRSREKSLRQRLDVYLAYVRHLGQEDAAQEALKQFQAEQQTRESPAIEYTLGQKTADFMRLVFSLGFGWALVTNFLTLALLGMAAWGLSKLPRVRGGQSLPVGISAGTVIALALALLGIIFLHDTRPEYVESTVLGVFVDMLVPLAGLAIFAVLRPSFRKPLGQGVLAGGVTLAALFGLATLSAWKISSALDVINWINSGSVSGSGTDNQNQIQIILADAAGLAVPLLLALIFCMTACVRRVPVSVGLIHGFCNAVLATVCVLVFLYGGLLLWTARQESAANYGLERSLHGEGQYLAQLTGQKWP